MKRDIVKNIFEADKEVTKHKRRNLKVSEIQYFYKRFRENNLKHGFYEGVIDLIVSAWLFGYSVGKRAGNQKKGA